MACRLDTAPGRAPEGAVDRTDGTGAAGSSLISIRLLPTVDALPRFAMTDRGRRGTWWSQEPPPPAPAEGCVDAPLHPFGTSSYSQPCLYGRIFGAGLGDLARHATARRIRMEPESVFKDNPRRPGLAARVTAAVALEKRYGKAAVGRNHVPRASAVEGNHVLHPATGMPFMTAPFVGAAIEPPEGIEDGISVAAQDVSDYVSECAPSGGLDLEGRDRPGDRPSRNAFTCVGDRAPSRTPDQHG